jgi:hypothetical protein
MFIGENPIEEEKGNVISRQIIITNRVDNQQRVLHEGEIPDEKGNIAKLADSIADSVIGGIESMGDKIHDLVLGEDDKSKEQSSADVPPVTVSGEVPVMHKDSMRFQ